MQSLFKNIFLHYEQYLVWLKHALIIQDLLDCIGFKTNT